MPLTMRLRVSTNFNQCGVLVASGSEIGEHVGEQGNTLVLCSAEGYEVGARDIKDTLRLERRASPYPGIRPEPGHGRPGCRLLWRLVSNTPAWLTDSVSKSPCFQCVSVYQPWVGLCLVGHGWGVPKLGQFLALGNGRHCYQLLSRLGDF